ncbi:MAG: orotidine-5'-phosphate decarboxylase [Gammaproteobacteria bacterium]|nr:orotidine-5'-phosphate decarboxylase [Gammaproteobacteria bacterium]
MNSDTSRLIIAMDFAEKNQALSLADKLDPKRCRLKVGKEMFTRFGPDLVKQLHNRGFELFLDLKYHDIPNTVAKACASAADMGVWMVNLHISGGRKMMEAAANQLQSYGKDVPLLTGVTVLTSMSIDEMHETGIEGSIEQRVLSLTKLAENCGLDGVVCSALEVSTLRKTIKDNFLLVTPGIRPAGSAVGDQHRIMAPVDALSAGSDYLVIGRPVTQAGEPLKVMCEIADSIDLWLSDQS